MKKVVIIGGGVSGLFCGIFALLKGFDVEIYEKNSFYGGLLNINKHSLYNCYLYGINKDSEIYQLYEQCQCLENVNFSEQLIKVGNITVSGKIDEFISSLLEISLFDKKNILEFKKMIELSKDINFSLIEHEQMNLKESFKYNFKIKKISKMYAKMKNVTILEYANRFESSDIQKMILSIFPSECSVSLLFMVLGSYFNNNLKYMTNSQQFVNNLYMNYKQLGGKIYLNQEIKKIIKEKSLIETTNKSLISYDYVISTIDPVLTYELYQLPLPRKFALRYEDYKNYIISSSLIVYVQAEAILTDVSQEVIEISPIKIGCSYLKKYLFHKLSDQSFSMIFNQDINDFEYWKIISQNKKNYDNEIKRIEAFIIKNIFNNIKIKNLSIITPNYCNTNIGVYKGSNYGFLISNNGEMINHPNYCSDNLYMSNQWLNLYGGITSSLISAYKTVNNLQN